jgi:hypothetical protein
VNYNANLTFGGHDHTTEISSKVQSGRKHHFFTVGNAGGYDAPTGPLCSPDWGTTGTYGPAAGTNELDDFHTEWRDSVGSTIPGGSSGTAQWSKFLIVKLSAAIADIEVWGVNTASAAHEGELLVRYAVPHPMFQSPVITGCWKNSTTDGRVYPGGIDLREQERGVRLETNTIVLQYGDVDLEQIIPQSAGETGPNVTDMIPCTGEETAISLSTRKLLGAAALSTDDLTFLVFGPVGDGGYDPAEIRQWGSWCPALGPSTAGASNDGMKFPSTEAPAMWYMIPPNNTAMAANNLFKGQYAGVGWFALHSAAGARRATIMRAMEVRLEYPDRETARNAYGRLKKLMQLDWLD